MRHKIVTRIVVSLAVLWAAAVVIFAWGTTRPVVTPPGAAGTAAGAGGEALFARHCATCHDPAGIGLDWRSAGERDAAAAAFREFLADHYGPSPEGNAAIVDYVMGTV